MFLIFIIIGYYEIVLSLSLFLSRAVVVMLNITPFSVLERCESKDRNRESNQSIIRYVVNTLHIMKNNLLG